MPKQLVFSSMKHVSIVFSTFILVCMAISIFDVSSAYAAESAPPSTCKFQGSIQNSSLYPGDCIQSGKGYTKLILTTSGNLILDDMTGSTGTPPNQLWAAPASGAVVRMQNDGNLVIYDSSDTTVWTSGTTGNDGARLTVQDDGNLVIYTSSDCVIWSTNTFNNSLTTLPRGPLSGGVGTGPVNNYCNNDNGTGTSNGTGTNNAPGNGASNGQ